MQLQDGLQLGQQTEAHDSVTWQQGASLLTIFSSPRGKTETGWGLGRHDKHETGASLNVGNNFIEADYGSWNWHQASVWVTESITKQHAGL